MTTTRKRLIGLAATAVLAGTALVGCGAKEAGKSVADARSYLSKGDYTAATIEIKNGLQAKPDSAELRFLLGRTLLGTGDASGAVVELDKAHELKFGDDQLLPVLARALLAAGQPDRVPGLVGPQPLREPKANGDLLASVAAAQRALGQPDKAKQALAGALASDPKNKNARMLQVRLVAGGGDESAAMRLLDALLAEEPALASAWVLKGELLGYAKHDPAAAETAFRQALKIDPRELRAHALLLQLMLARSDMPGFKTQVETLAKVAPSSFESRVSVVQLALAEGRLGEAREGAQQLLKVAPTHPLVLSLAGAIELQAGALTLAQNYLTKAVQRAPDVPTSRRLLAESYLRAGDGDKALTVVQELLDPLRPDAAALALAAQSHLLNGNTAQAQRYYEMAASAAPSDPRNRVAAALMELANGNAQAGFAQLEGMALSDKSNLPDLALVSAYAERKEFELALKAIDRLSAKNPDQPVAPVLRARILRLQGDLRGARTSLEAALKIDPTNYQAIGDLAALDLIDQKPEAALKRFEALLAKQPQNIPAALAVAELRLKTGAKPADVQKQIEDLVSRNPTDAGSRLALVEVLLEQRKTAAALAAAQGAASTLPDNLQVLDALGRAQLASGDSNQAVALFRRVAAALPSSPQPQLRLAETQVRLGDQKAAAEHYALALKMAPNLVEAQHGLMQLALSQKRIPEALKIARSMQKNQRGAIGYLFEAEIYASQRQWEPTVAAYRAALEREPSTEVAKRVFASLVVSKKPTDAKQFADTWEQAHPADVDFRFQSGNLLAERGDAAGAEAQYRKALALMPDNGILVNNIASAMVSQGKAGALELARKADSLSPDTPVVMDTLAAALSADKQFDKAIPMQRLVVEKAPTAPIFKLNLAKLLIQAGQPEPARKELQQLAQLGGDPALQREVASLMKGL